MILLSDVLSTRLISNMAESDLMCALYNAATNLVTFFTFAGAAQLKAILRAWNGCRPMVKGSIVSLRMRCGVFRHFLNIHAAYRRVDDHVFAAATVQQDAHVELLRFRITGIVHIFSNEHLFTTLPSADVCRVTNRLPIILGDGLYIFDFLAQGHTALVSAESILPLPRPPHGFEPSRSRWACWFRPVIF